MSQSKQHKIQSLFHMRPMKLCQFLLCVLVAWESQAHIQGEARPPSGRPLSVPAMHSELEQSIAQAQQLVQCAALRFGTCAPESLMTVATQKDAIIKTIAGVDSWPLALTSGVISQVTKGPFTEEAKNSIIAAVLAKHNEAPDQKPKVASQKHYYIHNYLTLDDWKKLQNPTLDFNSKAHVLVHRTRLLGLNHPNEVTYVRMAAILFVASQMAGDAVSPAKALATVRDLKVIFRSWKQRVSASVVNFPAAPDDFKKVDQTLFDCAYGTDIPVESQIDEFALERMFAYIPARKSHGTVVAGFQMPAQSRGREDALTGILQQMLMMRCGRQASSSCDGLPGLTFFAPQPPPSMVVRSRSAGALQGMMAAITQGPPEGAEVHQEWTTSPFCNTHSPSMADVSFEFHGRLNGKFSQRLVSERQGEIAFSKRGACCIQCT